MEVTSKDSLVSLSELYTGDWILLVSPIVYYIPFYNEDIFLLLTVDYWK